MTALHRLAVLVAIILMLGTFGASAQTSFCWKETWGTGSAKSIPQECGPNQELNGAFCYDKCDPGYTSNRIAGCIQNCPQGATDDGLFCGWPSYKVAEYPIWDESRCRNDHSSVGCEKIGLLWVEKCKGGYKHVLGFCEKSDISCSSLGLAGSRIANSCAKKTYGRAPQQAGCPAGQEFGAGLCYTSCGRNADRHGPVCWGQCPAGWVQCGMGCAKDEEACRAAVADQVVSVVDSAVSIALLVGTLGASSATKSGQSLLQKGAWEGVKKIGKKQVAEVMKNTAISLAGQGVSTITTSSINDTVDFIWDLGELDTSNMTEIEKEHAIANLSLKSASLIDPSGVVGIVAAYTKPLCKDIAAAQVAPASVPVGTTATASIYQSTLSSITDNTKASETLITNDVSVAAMEVSSKQGAMAAAKDPQQKARLAAEVAKANARLAIAQKNLAMSQRIVTNAQAWEKQVATMGKTPIGTTLAAVKPSMPPERPVAGPLRWSAVSGAARDIALSDNGAAWGVGTNAVAGGFGIWTQAANARNWQSVPGGAVRIGVAGDVPWVVNDSGAVFEYNAGTRRWTGLRAPKVVDIGASAKSVWIIAEPKQGANYTIYQRSGSSWKKASGAAVRVDVDADGNPWVVNSAGQIYALVKGRWQLFKSEPATDLSVGKFGEPWIVTRSGSIRNYDATSKQWLTQVDKSAEAVAVGASPWYLAVDQKIYKAR